MKFIVDITSPDQTFSPEEIKDYIMSGIHSNGLFIRMCPIMVEELKGSTEERIAALEYRVFEKWIEICPRCKTKNMNRLQKDFCFACAYKKGDKL